MLPTDTNLIVVKALERLWTPTSLSLPNTRICGTNPLGRLCLRIEFCSGFSHCSSHGWFDLIFKCHWCIYSWKTTISAKYYTYKHTWICFRLAKKNHTTSKSCLLYETYYGWVWYWQIGNLLFYFILLSLMVSLLDMLHKFILSIHYKRVVSSSTYLNE